MYELTISEVASGNAIRRLSKDHPPFRNRVGELTVVDGKLFFSFSGTKSEPIRADNLTFDLKELPEKIKTPATILQELENRVAELEQICENHVNGRFS